MAKPNFVLAVDLDGTLLYRDELIHPNDVALLKQGLPCPLILATGRSLAGVRRPLQANGLLDSSPVPYPLVLNNGSLSLLPGEKLLHNEPFPLEARRKIIEVCARHPEAMYVFQGPVVNWQLGSTPDGEQGAEMYAYNPLLRTPAELVELPFGKVVCLSLDRGLREAFARDIDGLPVEGNFSLTNIYEITPRGVNKTFGLKQLLPALGLEDLPLAIAGDGDNDLGMFAAAGYSFAPQTGREMVLQIAGQVIEVQHRGLLEPILETMAEAAPQK